MLKNIKFYFFKLINSRAAIVIAVFVFFLVIMIGRVFFLQIVKSEFYMTNYIQKSEKPIYTPGTRGTIYDKDGEILAYDELSYSVN